MEAVATGSKLLVWCNESSNSHALAVFTNSLVRLLESTLPTSGSTFSAKREKMWGAFHTIRCADKFRDTWEEFLQESVGCKSSPIFYQYVTDKLFRKLITSEFHVEDSHGRSESSPTELSYEEDNALRYTAGYVCRAVRKKLQREKGSEELLLSLDELTEQDALDEDDEDDDTKDWLRLSNRGGLLFVTDETFSLFHAMEQVIRRFLRVDRVKELSVGRREEIRRSIIEDEEVKTKWSVVSHDMEEKVGSILLGKIVDLWITIRGFSFAGAFIELYKQRAKTTLQKTKGLRKNLQTVKK